jgi:hypothetical protein
MGSEIEDDNFSKLEYNYSQSLGSEYSEKDVQNGLSTPHSVGNVLSAHDNEC